MKIVAGLGNPGEEHKNSRHNAGFLALESLKTRITNNQDPRSKQDPRSNFQYLKKFEAEIAQVGEVILVKPQTYMNRSGEAVVKIVQFYKISLTDLWVVHDDLDIRLGEYKIQMGKGPKIHNGLASIDQYLGTSDYWRVRIGTDNRTAEERSQLTGESYVLMPFRDQEIPIIQNVVLKAADELISRCL